MASSVSTMLLLEIDTWKSLYRYLFTISEVQHTGTFENEHLTSRISPLSFGIRKRAKTLSLSVVRVTPNSTVRVPRLLLMKAINKIHDLIRTFHVM